MSVSSQLKVDNWGNFFMQCLNRLAKKDKYCDYTIRSTSDESFKVHRVVLNTCSGYFVSLPSTDTSITMPAHLDFNAVKSVVMFMYTGQLYYKEETRMNLLEVADMLQMTVLLKLFESQLGLKKLNSEYHSPLPSTSKTHSAIALNPYKPAKKQVCNNLTVRSPPGHTPASTFINTMKVKDVLSENKPMRFECDAEDVPEFIENTFELPKYDSAPLLRQENVDSAKAMLKRTSDGELIDKNNKTPLTKCDTPIPSYTGSKKLKIVSDTDPENTNSKVVQEVLKKFPHLLQSKGKIKLKIMSSTNQSQFESLIINTPNSVEKILPVCSDVKEPLTTHKVKPDIMNVKGPWSCNLCGSDANPLHLESYFTFRRHLVEKHNEKEDTRFCEHCGHFLVRKDILIHHMYTKHNIQPPAGFKFPKCDNCGFVATTDIHLKRHKTTEKCGSKPQVTKSDVNYKCNECSRTFYSSLMLKGHLRFVHKIDEMSTSLTKKLLISVKDNVPPDAKVLSENKSLDKIEEVVLNDEDVLKQCGSKPQVTKSDVNYKCNKCSKTFYSSLILKGHLRFVHKIDEMSTSLTKKLLISVKDNVPPDAKVLAENKSLDKIEEVVLNDEDVLKQTEDLKDDIKYSEETTEVETVTLEDAAQVVNENTTKLPIIVDITEDWVDLDVSKKNDTCIIELDD